MKIISYNVNGIRAAIGKGFLDWLSTESPDVVCLQELKAMSEQIPVLEIEALGYKSYFYSAKRKGYSGVGILSKQEPLHIEYGMGIEKYDDEGRFIRADFADYSVVSVYHPSGTSGEERQDFKMQWLDDFAQYVGNLKQKHHLILCGDYNICHRAIDIHDPVRNATNSGFLPEEREWIDGFIRSGFIDSFRYTNGDVKDCYSWWSYRFNARTNNKGWRIDYIMVDESLKERITSADILSSAVHSDHCPIVMEIR
ncbi:MAG: exodeoxyribonuclease III [Bacteroidales bacterium]|jgi:exodeoxyribonuclease-3|nr:exodeoxyribonuclease III [Bacteroidales bacterium]